MPNDGSCLVVFNLDCAWPVLAPVIWPSQIPRQNVFRTLKPVETNNRGSGSLVLAVLDTAPREGIDLIPCNRCLCRFRATAFGNSFPGIWNVPVKLIGMQTVNNAPSSPAQSNSFLALAWPLAPRAVADDIVDFVGAHASARAAGHVVLVEGESDCHTFWFHDIPAVGIPRAANWREERDAQHLDGIETIYVIIESDAAGEAVKKWLSCSTIRSRAKLVSLPAKDPSALHLEGPAEFKRRWQVACLGALPWAAVHAEARAEERAEAWNQCADLARSPCILSEFDNELERIGVVGERRGAKLIYLAVTSRLLDRPVSVAVKGASRSWSSPR
jgi:hypothetical protein